MSTEGKSVCVVVLGDVGRSPRMQYHSLSLAKEGFNVDIIGYEGSEPLPELVNNPRVVFRYLSRCPDFQEYCPRLLAYALKVLWQSITLLFVLLFKRRSDHVLVQNPPAIPALGICWFYTLIMCSNYIIDWHNYGFSIMALTLGNKHNLVRISSWFEGFCGRRASANLCVTLAMKEDLKSRWNINAVTLYDRPAECFKPISLLEQHQFFMRLGKEHSVFNQESDLTKSTFTEEKADGSVVLRADRPGLVVSSTSWTEDEDFSVLLSALQDYETACSSGTSSLPSLVCAITGKGPLKQHYCNIIERNSWRNVQVVTPWLHPDDYPRLLASADLGVSLHTSSSGLDLPMKVVDMFGCGLPVLAYDFPCLKELVRHGENSYKFKNTQELSTLLQSWFEGFPNNPSQNAINLQFRRQLESYRELHWHENWMFSAFSLFT
ncbi:chitobiosyldiphosphodolichol beta-mannosyltransferase [Anabrus simplex]|uniref:chitobiosyldiphosphodolichol beta-mannosyltransferase n=1 Tax=Anabrus simplex TaxID=316456 RepID=UPI0035A27050